MQRGKNAWHLVGLKWIAALVSALVVGISSSGRADSSDRFAAALNAQMPELLEKYRVPGAVISCIRNGDVVWTKAFGRANLSTDGLMRPDLVFNHGSNGKVLTAWGIMRLVEEGKVDLDAPANRYLKRWQLRSSQFDPNAVTIRRLLSHTAGLTVHGFMDYNQRRRLPNLVEMLEGRNQVPMFNGEVNGAVLIKWQPGSRGEYSGGGFVILQMIIEDVSGESFASFMHREVTAPLKLDTLQWTWTPELEVAAPMPYGELQEPVGYRQLACQSIGSEVCSVADFARFLAAAVPSAHAEPVGRGVLTPESVAQMLEIQTNSDGSGLGYGVAWIDGHKILGHSGANPGWNAQFLLDATQREGFVIANNSALGGPFNGAVNALWWRTMRSQTVTDPPPASGFTIGLNRLVLRITLVFGTILTVITGRRVYQVACGKLRWSRRPSKRWLLVTSFFAVVTLIWWYLFYAPPSLPLPISPAIPDIWVLPLVNYFAEALLGCVGISLFFAFLRGNNAELKDEKRAIPQ
ncbi:serine hydrolase domain-containing protein [Pedosphaera parvula]|uniref:Beta-lactamase n=1 Tax=Pedosphaera parvula (strain Ellin514) TaxID=320771 RepID=B9XI92_PEDPL|nr:serine hydrolase domain-containing protein [Pedosphaera parvula]EEF60353.1 beta-lactamase [Pedosphaera parvula Ellin514]